MVELGLLSAGITLFINYIIGKPGAEFSPYEIFSRYTVWLSIMRLKKIGLIDVYHDQFQSSVDKMEDEYEIIPLRHDYHKMLYNAAEPFFTWERAVGMCSVCTGVWIAILVYAVSLINNPILSLLSNIFDLLTIIVISHITIRILNKVL
jgi:hypothetical protein